jgi:hypothetical protein
MELVTPGSKLQIDFSGAKIIDLTVQEAIANFKRGHELTGGSVALIGLHKHVASTKHKFALKSSTAPIANKTSPRQKILRALSNANKWSFDLGQDSSFFRLQTFHFFDSRPIEYKENILQGKYLDDKVDWELSDVTFSEGAMLAKEVYHSTMQYIKLSKEAPQFVLRREELVDRVFDRVRVFGSMRDINFSEYPEFSKQYYLTGEDKEKIKSFFNDEILTYFINNPIEYIECNGKEIIVVGGVGITKTEDIIPQIKSFEVLMGLIDKTN